MARPGKIVRQPRRARRVALLRQKLHAHGAGLVSVPSSVVIKRFNVLRLPRTAFDVKETDACGHDGERHVQNVNIRSKPRHGNHANTRIDIVGIRKDIIDSGDERPAVQFKRRGRRVRRPVIANRLLVDRDRGVDEIASRHVERRPVRIVFQIIPDVAPVLENMVPTTRDAQSYVPTPVPDISFRPSTKMPQASATSPNHAVS